MSLFKAREWWSTTVGDNENYDTGCLCVANIDNAQDKLDKIIVGSYHGFLRIYQPHSTSTESGEFSGFSPGDVICEMHLQLPVLQIDAGKFVSGTKDLQLAVLHPMKISVYTVKATQGKADHGTQYQVQKAYEHNLKRTAYNFCFGSFGGVKGRDFLCVQSMDGTLSFYEQESYAFTRFLPGALLPGPIRYNQKNDSFITVSASWHLESYKYQVLAVAADSKADDSQSNKSGKRVACDWNFNLGESALDLYICEFSGSPVTICVLGIHNLFTFTDTGKLQSMKKFDYNPSCFLPYTSLSENKINCIVGTHTNTLMIYEDITLKWAAQLTNIPVHVATGHFSGLRGVVVTIDEEGHLQCSYLGTDPAMFTTPSAEVREIDYNEQDRELNSLQTIIKQKQQTTTAPMPNRKSSDDLSVTLDVPYSTDTISVAHSSEVRDEEPIPSITVKVQLKARMNVSDVKVSIHVPPPLTSSEQLLHYPTIDPSQSCEASVSFFMMHELIPSTMTAEIITSYINGSGAPRVCCSSVKLPFRLTTKPVSPVKDATYKITIDTTQPLVCLKELFTELVDESLGVTTNAIGLQIYGGPAVTVLASKTSQRYRLQCDQFEGLWPVLNELVVRLKGHSSHRQHTSAISFKGSLPLQEYFDVLDKHFELRLNSEHFHTLLSSKAGQFRAIQRRLLTRFKDKTPAPLDNMDTLLDGTYRQILAVVSRADENNHQLEVTANHLECATRQLNLLIKLWAQLPEKQFEVLQAAITPIVTSNGEHGWEEMVDASVTHLLRTCLAKNTKDTTVNPTPLAMLKDTTKLKKHIALLCDRLNKGGTLAIEGMDMTETKAETSAPHKSQNNHKKPTSTTLNPMSSSLLATVNESPANKHSNSNDETEVPIGSKFGESKSPRGDKSPRGHHGGLPPMDGGKLAPIGARGGALPSLNGIGPTPPESNLDNKLNRNNLSDLVSNNATDPDYDEDAVPDLDDIGTVDHNGPLINGDGETVYGL